MRRFLMYYIIFSSVSSRAEESRSVFDTIQKSHSSVLVRCYGNADISTFNFVRILDSALKGVETSVFMDYADNYALKYARTENNSSIDSLIAANFCKDNYLSVARLFSDRVYGLQSSLALTYIHDLNQPLWFKLDSLYKNSHGYGFSGKSPNEIFSQDQAWLYHEIPELLDFSKFDSALFLSFSSLFSPLDHFDKILDSGFKGRWVYILGYGYDENFNYLDPKYLKQDPNLDSALVVNFIVGNGTYSRELPMRTIPGGFNNKLNRSYDNWEIIDYGDLPKKIQLFEDIYIDKKVFQNQINVYIDSVYLSNYFGMFCG